VKKLAVALFGGPVLTVGLVAGGCWLVQTCNEAAQEADKLVRESGQECARHGVPPTACPFGAEASPGRRRLWLEGWIAGKLESEARVK
jgi:hypothetical protein